VRNAVKAIAMEKETFDCYDAQSTLSHLRDVETFIEIVHQAAGRKPPRLSTVKTTVEAFTCLKNLKTGRISCGWRSVPLASTNRPLTRCSPAGSAYPFAPITQPTHPVEMSTVVASNNLVSTVKVEKEVFDCAGQIGDLYLFTEILESPDKKRSFTVVQRRFSGILCLKNEATARITQCKLFKPGRL